MYDLIGDVHGHIAAPSLNAVEDDDANRIAVLAIHQIADQRFAVGAVRVGFSPSPAEPATEVIENEVSVLIRPMGRE